MKQNNYVPLKRLFLWVYVLFFFLSFFSFLLFFFTTTDRHFIWLEVTRIFLFSVKGLQTWCESEDYIYFIFQTGYNNDHENTICNKININIYKIWMDATRTTGDLRAQRSAHVILGEGD